MSILFTTLKKQIKIPHELISRDKDQTSKNLMSFKFFFSSIIEFKMSQD